MDKELIQKFRREGIITLPVPSVTEQIPFLQKQLDSIYKNNKKVRPWHLWELHNPWSRSAQNIDSWAILDLCQSSDLMTEIACLIGEDIIFYDAQLSPAFPIKQLTDKRWMTDSQRCPVVPLNGLVVRIPLFSSFSNPFTIDYYREDGYREIPTHAEKMIDVLSGQIILHDINLHYRIRGLEKSVLPVEFVMRYFPATSCYQRDPSTKYHRNLTEQYPLLNYA